jgi:antirestriction protein ArdC
MAQQREKREKRDIRAEITAKVIESLNRGVAPWQRPWDVDVSMFPKNGVSGRRYRGGNSLNLLMESNLLNYTDSRWFTFKQIHELGGNVIKGQHGSPVEYWKFSNNAPILDENGEPMLNTKGKPVMQAVKLRVPQVFYTTVFNFCQTEGLPPAVVDEKDIPVDRDAIAEEFISNLIINSGVPLVHDQPSRAFYRPSTDTVHLPKREMFHSDAAYYGVVAHELAHSTGHAIRLDRDLTGEKDSVSYAKEELRAELASYFLAAEYGINHDGDNHDSYIASWITVLENDKHELFRAATDAGKIVQYMTRFDRPKDDVNIDDDDDMIFGDASPDESEDKPAQVLSRPRM